MTETTNRKDTAMKARPRDEQEKALQGRRGTDTPPGTRGNTTVADGVVAQIAGMAAREIPEIHNLGGRDGQSIRGGARARTRRGQRHHPGSECGDR
jgi:hypothetical protein